jgi:hypothetical protein
MAIRVPARERGFHPEEGHIKVSAANGGRPARRRILRMPSRKATAGSRFALCDMKMHRII